MKSIKYVCSRWNHLFIHTCTRNFVFKYNKLQKYINTLKIVKYQTYNHPGCWSATFIQKNNNINNLKYTSSLSVYLSTVRSFRLCYVWDPVLSLSHSSSGLCGPMGTEWRCIKPLTVFTCAGLMLMGGGRPGATEWEIDQHWMCVRGVLTSTTAFRASRPENPSFKKPHASPDSPHLPHRLIRYQRLSQDTWSALYDRVFSPQKHCVCQIFW